MDASLVSGFTGAITSAISAQAASSIAKLQANTANQVRALNNGTVAAVNARNAQVTSLQRWAQGVRNSRVDDQIADTQEALTTNFNRSRDARTNANFSASIAQAEQAGRIQASAAASGVGGSVVDVVNMTFNLKNAVKEQARLDEERYIVVDQKQREFKAKWALEDQKDYSLIFDNLATLDYKTNLPATTANVGSAALAGFISGAGGFKQAASAIGGAGDYIGGFFKTKTTAVDLLGFPVDQ